MEIENVRVILRIKPISSEEWMEDHEDILNVDGNIITVNPPNGLFFFFFSIFFFFV